MPPAKFKPQHGKTRDQSGELARKKALLRLENLWKMENDDGQWEPESEPAITPMLASIDGGIGRCIQALRVHDDEDARTFLQFWDACTATDRKHLSIEEIAHASGVGSLRLAEVTQTALFLYADMQHQMLVSSTKVKVLKSIIKAATDEVPIIADTLAGRVVVGKTNGDVKAMELFGRISGQVPLPKNTVNNYTANNTQNNFGDQKQLPENGHEWKYPEDRTKQIMAIINPKQLEAGTLSEEHPRHFSQNQPIVFER